MKSKNTFTTLITLILILCISNNLAYSQNEKVIRELENLPQHQVLELVMVYHKKLEQKYNISPPKKFNVTQNYNDIAPMYGPKGFYTPSVPNGVAICYGVYMHPNGRLLPDPQYADHTTLENTSKVLKRRHDLAKLEYVSIKTYNHQIAKARLLENK